MSLKGMVKHTHPRTRLSNTANVLAFSSLMPPIIRDGRHRYEYNVGKREWVTAAFPAAFPAGEFRGCVAKTHPVPYLVFAHTMSRSP